MKTHLRSVWQREADRRWPDGMDMVERPVGHGRFASVAWCTGLTVYLYHDREAAAEAVARITRAGCGHDCWGDHELVDLKVPAVFNPDTERIRLLRRFQHFQGCGVCDWVFGGQAPGAAFLRGQARQTVAAV